jgi:hypothetical protein
MCLNHTLSRLPSSVSGIPFSDFFHQADITKRKHNYIIICLNKKYFAVICEIFNLASQIKPFQMI